MIVAALWIISLIVVFFIGRNNPSLPIVNRLIAAKKVIVDAAGNITKAVK